MGNFELDIPLIAWILICVVPCLLVMRRGPSHPN
jgi:hypothetical protein